ncbi:MAG: hypothetical protein LBV41_09520 [Cytophagaceae bacterium]|nr:hypothetical protein [Cytophagaceae bacterium]
MKNAIIIIVAVLLFVAASCLNTYKGCKNMPEQLIGTGEIIDNALIDSDEPFDIFLIDEYQVLSDERLIINSDSANIYHLRVSFDSGITFNPIDFSKYTVLGNYAEGACRAVFDRHVTKNIEQQKYIYKINVIYCGMCEKLEADMNFILIPKIEDGFSVEFIVESERW